MHSLRPTIKHATNYQSFLVTHSLLFFTAVFWVDLHARLSIKERQTTVLVIHHIEKDEPEKLQKAFIGNDNVMKI